MKPDQTRSFRKYALIPVAASLFLVALLANACGPLPTVDTALIYTSAAKTGQAQSPQQAAKTVNTQHVQQPVPVSTIFPTHEAPLPPTETPLPTLPPPPSDTPLPPTETPIPPTATPPIPCNQMQFIADLSTTANATLPVGAGFTKTWRVQNTGSCTWNAGYALHFASGDPMDGAPFALPIEVAPGQIADLSLRLVAPLSPGFYQAGWLLSDGAGQTFGAGPGGSDPLAVSIRTIQLSGISSFSFDLSNIFCAAAWSGPAGSLECPGIPGDMNGSVNLLERANLEARPANTYLLSIQPSQAVGGWISGRFPPYIARSGDHFVTEIGCLWDSPGCDLSFQVSYQTQSGASGILGNWREIYDGSTTVIDLDISWLAGESVTLMLTTSNNGLPAQANAFWLAPHIQNTPLPPQNTLILQWTRDGDARYPCSEVYIYNNGGVMNAQVFDCSLGRVELGWVRLSSTDQAQLFSWQQSLQKFNSEQYKASPDEPIVTWLDFNGAGFGNASDADIAAISNLAAHIFASLARPR